MNTYTLGTSVVLPVTFEDAVTAAPGDPTRVILRVLDPVGAETDYTAGVAHPSTGVYQVIIAPRVPGIWKYRWEGSGAIVAAFEGRFEVQPSLFRVLNTVHTSDTGQYAVTGASATFVRR